MGSEWPAANSGLASDAPANREAVSEASDGVVANSSSDDTRETSLSLIMSSLGKIKGEIIIKSQL